LKILCINPNSSSEVTEGIEKICKRYALPETEVEVKYIKEAPPGIESYLDAAISEKYLLERFEEWKEEYDGFITGCIHTPFYGSILGITGDSDTASFRPEGFGVVKGTD